MSKVSRSVQTGFARNERKIRQVWLRRQAVKSEQTKVGKGAALVKHRDSSVTDKRVSE